MARKPAAKAAKPAAKKAAPKAPARKAAPRAAKAKAPAMKAVKVTAVPGKSITQAALMVVVADRTSMSKAEVKRFLDTYFDIVKAHLMKGVKVKLGDIGTLSIRARKARFGRNPRTGEPVKIKASKKLAFRQSVTMRDAI